MREVRLHALEPERLAAVVGRERLDHLVDDLARELRDDLAGRSIININTAEVGGGVAEMLRVLLPYSRGAGIDARWFVMEGSPEFFRVTKRIHHRLHGRPGDGGPLGEAEADLVRTVAAANADGLRADVVPGDVVVIHDPQPAALIPLVSEWDAPVVWRCHIGSDRANEFSDEAWTFLRQFFTDNVAAYVFSRKEYAPSWVPADRLHIIHPSIDPWSPKNLDVDPDHAIDALRHTGIIDGGPSSPVSFTRADGSPGRLDHFADIIRTGPPPGPEAPMVVQVSRWDPLKDMAGVMQGFADYVLDGSDAHLVLAGPVVTSVADDPEGAEVLQDVWRAWRDLPHAARSRVQLVCLPMADNDENAAIVNALQRHATVVVQKSIEEGFGLTVTEAMYKRRPVVASAVGGIVDQIDHGVTGLLVDDPTDLESMGALVSSLLSDQGLRDRLGAAARQAAVDRFLPDSSLSAWTQVVASARSLRATT